MTAMTVSAIVCDVGETLVDETRLWTQLADDAGLTPFTVMGTLGSVIARGAEHHELWEDLGAEPPTSWPLHSADDLYPDAVDFLAEMRGRGYVVGIAGNQPAGTAVVLRELGVPADFVASSAEWGVAKPSPEFFSKVADACGCGRREILYVGDRVDNDIVPASEAGLQTCHLRRGPWGVIQARWPEAARATLHAESLRDLGDQLRRFAG